MNSFRSQEQIVAKIERIKNNDFFGFKTIDLIGYLDYDHARQYLKKEYTRDDWMPNPTDRDSILKQIEEYMPFAWDKANNLRGISAGRSMAHFTIWVWMLGDEDRFDDLEDYQYYGKDNLRKICDVYGWDADQWDDGIRTNG
jgi:hypothetical protein